MKVEVTEEHVNNFLKNKDRPHPFLQAIMERKNVKEAVFAQGSQVAILWRHDNGRIYKSIVPDSAIDWYVKLYKGKKVEPINFRVEAVQTNKTFLS